MFAPVQNLSAAPGASALHVLVGYQAGLAMSNRTAIVLAIQDYVACCHADGKILDVNAAALELTREYPQSGLTINEICDQLEQAAIRRHVALLSERRPDAAAPSE
jgi:hypothetical protein